MLPFLAAESGRSLRFRIKGLAPQEERFLFVRVDRKREVAASCEDNDRPWQVIR